MTQQEQALADDRMRAEIANLMNQTIKLGAETAKLNAETVKISRERFLIPVTIFGGVLVGMATVLARLFTA